MECSKECIMIVDDSPFMIKTLIEMLNPDYKVLSSLSGKSALEIIHKKHVDLILLDLVMPDLNGYDVCKQLKNNYKTQNIPVIFVSDKNTDEAQVYGIELGAVDYLVKPVCEVVLKAKIRTHLNFKKRNDELEKMSFFDELTKVANRRFFDKVLASEWESALRKRDFLSLLFIDIDFFKAYNDFYGHMVGDICLQKIAKALKMTVTSSNALVARYGGEEFTIVLPKVKIRKAYALAQKLKSNVARLKIPHIIPNNKACVTVSIGVVTVLATPKFCCLDLLEKADQAMYQSKRRGRNKVTVLNMAF